MSDDRANEAANTGIHSVDSVAWAAASAANCAARLRFIDRDSTFRPAGSWVDAAHTAHGVRRIRGGKTPKRRGSLLSLFSIVFVRCKHLCRRAVSVVVINLV